MWVRISVRSISGTFLMIKSNFDYALTKSVLEYKVTVVWQTCIKKVMHYRIDFVSFQLLLVNVPKSSCYRDDTFLKLALLLFLLVLLFK